MRKHFLLSVVILFLAHAIAGADDSQIKHVTDLRDVAQNPANRLLQRTNAIDDLGTIRPNDDWTRMLLKDTFKELLATTKVQDYERNFFVYHVVLALGKGNLGSAAKDLVADLDLLTSKDSFLDVAIRDTRSKINGIATPASAPAVSGHADAVKKALAELKDATKDGVVRLGAAGTLAGLLKGAIKEDVNPILAGLLQAVENQAASTRILAAKTATKEALDGARTALKADAEWTKWTGDFIADLKKMLDKKSEVGERLAAVVALGAFGTDAAAVAADLQKLAKDDADDLVKLKAADALPKVGGTK